MCVAKRKDYQVRNPTQNCVRLCACTPNCIMHQVEPLFPLAPKVYSCARSACWPCQLYEHRYCAWQLPKREFHSRCTWNSIFHQTIRAVAASSIAAAAAAATSIDAAFGGEVCTRLDNTCWHCSVVLRRIVSFAPMCLHILRLL